MSDPVPCQVTMKKNMDYLTDELRKSRAEIDRLRAEVADLKKALKPLADAAELVMHGEDHWIIGAGVYYGHARAARAILDQHLPTAAEVRGILAPARPGIGGEMTQHVGHRASDEIARLNGELDRLRAEVTEMKTALLDYGEHNHSCRKHTYPLLEPKECDCGWSAVVAKHFGTTNSLPGKEE